MSQDVTGVTGATGFASLRERFQSGMAEPAGLDVLGKLLFPFIIIYFIFKTGSFYFCITVFSSVGI